jgi:hypothetical protein
MYTISTNTLTLIAGSTTAGFGYVDNATGTNARFNDPFGIAIDPANQNLYIGDRGNFRIRRIALTGTYAVTTVCGSGVRGSADGNGTSATLGRVGGLRVNSANTFLYFTEEDNNLLRRVTIASPFTVLTLAGTVGDQVTTFNGPRDLTFYLNEAYLLIVNQGYQIISGYQISNGAVFNWAGVPFVPNPINTAAQNGDRLTSLFRAPRTIFADSANNVYIGEDEGRRVRKATNNNVGTTRPLHTLEYVTGGFNHYITSKHTPINGTADTNSIDFYLNTSSNASDSSAIGTGNSLAASITSAGIRHNGYLSSEYINSNGILSKISHEFFNYSNYPLTTRTRVAEVKLDTGNFPVSMALMQNSYADNIDMAFLTPTGTNNPIPVERMTITGGVAGGRVGINTTAPDNTLTVKGVVQVTDPATDQKYAFYSDASKFQLNPRNSSGNYNNINAFVMDTGGRVAIGLATPNYQLSVKEIIQVFGDANDVMGLFAATYGDYMHLGSWNKAGSAQKNLVLNQYGANVGICTNTPSESLELNGVLNLLGGTVKGDAIVDNSNKTNTYIRFGPNGAGSDWAYLRQIGADNRIHIALDFHDDANDGTFSIRRIGSSASEPDAAPVTLFTVNENAQIGIGMSNPNGNIQFVNADVRRRIVFWETANNDHQTCAIGKGVMTMNFQNPQTGDDFVFQAGTSASASTELFRIRGNGRIGINCNAAAGMLHLNHPSGVDVASFLITMAAGQNYAMVRLSNLSGGGVTMAIPQSGGQWNTGAASNDFVLRNESASRRIFINTGDATVGACFSNGYVGIGVNNPQCRLDIQGPGPQGGSDTFVLLRNSANDGSAKTLLQNAGVDATLMTIGWSSYSYTYWRSGNTYYRIISNGSTFFTGQHGNVSSDSNLNIANLSSLVGLIVSSADTGYTRFDKNNSTITGKDAIWTTEALPNIKLTNTDKDKAVWGVITNHNNESYNTDGSPSIDQDSIWADKLGKRFRINGLGEGAIWITNINGNLENGDYICSSLIPGYGRKQDDDLLHNYTVAKITMSCSFDLNQNNYVCQEFVYQGKTYRKAYVGCTYHCS